MARLPAQQNAVVEAVSKTLLPAWSPTTVSFTPLEEIERALERRVAQLDLHVLASRLAQDVLDRARGRI